MAVDSSAKRDSIGQDFQIDMLAEIREKLTVLYEKSWKN